MHLLSAAGTACLVSLQGCQVRAVSGCSTRRISRGIMKELITGPSRPSQRKIIQQAFWKKAPLQFSSPSIGVGLPSASSSDCTSCRQPTLNGYAEKYLREVWSAVTRSLKEVGIGCELNLVRSRRLAGIITHTCTHSDMSVSGTG